MGVSVHPLVVSATAGLRVKLIKPKLDCLRTELICTKLFSQALKRER
jgi:hypothetical protein